MPLNRAGEINFYEELGVEQNAAPEQIRDSFRSLVRLLHPDHQTDDQLKEIAEKQMRKLNRIYSVLADPERRRHYDDLLRGEDLPPTIVFSPAASLNFRRLMARFAWIGAVLVSVAFLAWLASEGGPGPQTQAFDHLGNPQKPLVSPPATGDPSDELSRLRVDLRTVTAERDAAIRELGRLRGTSASGAASTKTPNSGIPAASPEPVAPRSTASISPVLTTMTELPSAPRIMPPPPAIQPTRLPPATRPLLTSPHSFAGFWFYNRPPQGQHNKNQSLYLPEFIEATVTEQNGQLHGRYRSRYQIVDRAISPDVNFEFNCAPTGASVFCPWAGSGGSRGELTMKITGENAMRIDWTAAELGNTLGLNSGTAILVRRLD